jgi:hypothetical protein
MGCAVSHTPVIIDTVTVEHVIVHDSIVTLPVDSSYIRAWFECDSLNNVVMTQLDEIAGQLIQPTTTFDSGMITVNAKVDSQFIYLTWKERYDSIVINTETIKKVDKIVYKKPAWLMWLAGLGGGCVILLVLLLIILKKTQLNV